jgi:hypothetical protein
MSSYQVNAASTALCDLSIQQKIVLPGDIEGSLERELSGFRVFGGSNEMLCAVEKFDQKVQEAFAQFNGTVFRVAGSKASGVEKTEVHAIQDGVPGRRKLCAIEMLMTEKLTCSNKDLAQADPP